uniref:DUF4116 domain-containing protein n=1 Tax=Zooxanthella nutricula TaxID=1333877 RepID=A0A7S2KTC8_9DINO
MANLRDRQAVLDRLRHDHGFDVGDDLQRLVPEASAADHDFGLRVVRASRGRAVPPALCADRAFMLKAGREAGRALRAASEQLRADQDFMLQVVREDGAALKFAAEELLSDRGFMLAALRRSSGALHFAAKELTEDREFMLAAMRQSGKAARFLAGGLRDDPELQPERSRRNPFAAVGQAAPVLSADVAVPEPGGGVEVTVMTPSGAGVTFELPAEGTLGDMARVAIERLKVKGGIVHMHIGGSRISPFDADSCVPSSSAASRSEGGA